MFSVHKKAAVSTDRHSERGKVKLCQVGVDGHIQVSTKARAGCHLLQTDEEEEEEEEIHLPQTFSLYPENNGAAVGGGVTVRAGEAVSETLSPSLIYRD